LASYVDNRLVYCWFFDLVHYVVLASLGTRRRDPRTSEKKKGSRIWIEEAGEDREMIEEIGELKEKKRKSCWF